MSEDPNAQQFPLPVAVPVPMPLPVLGYYPQEQSAALRMLVRLVLIVGLVNGLLSAISFAGGLIEGSPPLPPLIDVAIGVGQVIAWVGVSVSCAIVVVAGRGQTFAIGAQLAAVFVDACYFGRSMWVCPYFVAADCPTGGRHGENEP